MLLHDWVAIGHYREVGGVDGCLEFGLALLVRVRVRVRVRVS